MGVADMQDRQVEERVDDADLDDEALPQFAAWLREQRTKKGWTQKKLSTESGISGQQISNLETGRSRNPQSETVDALKKALGETPPEAALKEEEVATEIPGLGSLRDFDPYATERLPEVRGVYVFYDKTKRPVYVGRATKRPISKRVAEHADKFWFKPPVVNSAFYLEIDNEQLCAQTEQVLIKFLRTHLLLNKQGVETDPDDDNG